VGDSSLTQMKRCHDRDAGRRGGKFPHCQYKDSLRTRKNRTEKPDWRNVIKDKRHLLSEKERRRRKKTSRRLGKVVRSSSPTGQQLQSEGGKIRKGAIRAGSGGTGRIGASGLPKIPGSSARACCRGGG